MMVFEKIPAEAVKSIEAELLPEGWEKKTAGAIEVRWALISDLYQVCLLLGDIMQGSSDRLDSEKSFTEFWHKVAHGVVLPKTLGLEQNLRFATLSLEAGGILDEVTQHDRRLLHQLMEKVAGFCRRHPRMVG